MIKRLKDRIVTLHKKNRRVIIGFILLLVFLAILFTKGINSLTWQWWVLVVIWITQFFMAYKNGLDDGIAIGRVSDQKLKKLIGRLIERINDGSSVKVEIEQEYKN